MHKASCGQSCAGLEDGTEAYTTTGAPSTVYPGRCWGYPAAVARPVVSGIKPVGRTWATT